MSSTHNFVVVRNKSIINTNLSLLLHATQLLPHYQCKKAHMITDSENMVCMAK